MRKIIAIVACAGFATVFCLAVTRAQAPADSRKEQASIDAGRKLFADTCANDHCHGGSAADVRDFPPRTREYVTRVISEGLPTAGMQAFKDVFASEQIEQLVDYVLSESGGVAGNARGSSMTSRSPTTTGLANTVRPPIRAPAHAGAVRVPGGSGTVAVP